MKFIQVVAGRTTDLKDVIDIDRGNIFLLRSGKRDSTYVVDIGTRWQKNLITIHLSFRKVISKIIPEPRMLIW